MKRIKKKIKKLSFEYMLSNALMVHLDKSEFDWEFCPFNDKERYSLTYDKALFYGTNVQVGKCVVDFYFPHFNLVVLYNRKIRKKEMFGEDLSVVIVKQGEEFEGIIKIITHLMHYAFVY